MSIAERARESDLRTGKAAAPHRTSFRRKLKIRLAAVMLWLHIYLSMIGLAAVLFFSVTGLTLNHPNWFYAGAESRTQAAGTMDLKWLHLPTPGAAAGDESDPSREVAKLEVVEHLRQAHGIRGALADFRVDELECSLTFKGPGYAADVLIDRESGKYDVTQTYHGVIAVVNDLHKGRDTGPAWSLVIDVSAVVLTIISLTGLVLLFFLRLRRVPGLVVIALGTAVLVAVIRLGVP